jgi:hypothetical protein
MVVGGRYAVAVAPHTDDQRSEEAHRTVYDAMEKAMQARGFRTARALAQALNASGYKVSERAVAAWRSRESSIPGWALVALSEVSGLSLDALMGQDGDVQPKTVGHLEERIGGLQERLDAHDRELAKVGGLLAQMIQALDDEGISLPAAGRKPDEAVAERQGRRALGGN